MRNQLKSSVMNVLDVTFMIKSVLTRKKRRAMKITWDDSDYSNNERSNDIQIIFLLLLFQLVLLILSVSPFQKYRFNDKD